MAVLRRQQGSDVYAITPNNQGSLLLMILQKLRRINKKKKKYFNKA